MLACHAIPRLPTFPCSQSTNSSMQTKHQPIATSTNPFPYKTHALNVSATEIWMSWLGTVYMAKGRPHK